MVLLKKSLVFFPQRFQVSRYFGVHLLDAMTTQPIISH